MFKDTCVVIIGAGDSGTAIALRLFKSGFRPIIAERDHPSDLHAFRNFSDTVYLGEKQIEHITGRLYHNSDDKTLYREEINRGRLDRVIPIINIESADDLYFLDPNIIIDCRGKYAVHTDFNWSLYPCVIRIGNRFKVGNDGHFVVGTFGKELGRVFHTPKELEQVMDENSTLTTAPLEGVFISDKSFGDVVSEREEIGTINEIAILAPNDGIISGLLHSGHFVFCKQPLFELSVGHARDVNIDKSTSVECLAIAGGVLEAVLTYLSQNRSA
jgi:hypothetical protein